MKNSLKKGVKTWYTSHSWMNEGISFGVKFRS